MGENNLADSEWIQAGIQGSVSAIPQASDNGISPRSKGHFRGNTEIRRERSNTGDKQRQGGVLFQTVSCPQEGWPNAAIDQPPTFEPISGSQPFQDGGHARSEGSPTKKNDWMTRIDLKDAYFSIPIHQKLLRFRWEKKSFQFTCPPFGLASAPRVFTKILRSVVFFLRSKGIRCVIYLDDILLLDQDKAKLMEHTATTLSLLEALGFLVNYPKSVLELSQKPIFLGFVIDSVKKELNLPQEKIEVIFKEAKAIVKLQQISGPANWEDVGSPSGNSTCPTPLSEAHSFEEEGFRIGLSQAARKDLEWWIHNLSEWNGRAVQTPDPTLVIETDASKKGWGGHSLGE